MPEASHDDNLLFLETTTQIERIIGTQERRDTIRQNLQNRRLCTSGHVLGEFNKTLIQDAITFRNLLLSSQDVEEAIRRLDRYLPQGRKFGRTVKLLTVLAWGGDKQTTLDRLADFIDWRAIDHFWDSVDESYFTDEVKCAPSSWSPARRETGEYDVSGLKCLKDEPPPCLIMAFIERNRDEISTFVNAACGTSRPNVAKAAKAFGEILAGRDVPFGERSNCYPISDTLIALEAYADAEIYSTDGDYRVICELLGRTLYAEQPFAR